MRTLNEVFAPGASTLPEGLRTLAVSPERELEPGMTVRATFTFRNQGGAAATGVRVRFNLPDGLVYLVGTGTLDGRDLDDELGNSPLLARSGADIGDVAPGEERRIEISYSVAGAIENGSTIELQAAVAAFELPPVGSNVVRLIARSKPQLENALTNISIDAPPRPKPGSEATLTLRVHNAGESSAHDVAIRMPVPHNASYVPLSARLNGRDCERELGRAFDPSGATVVSPLLPSSATATFSYRVRIDAPLENGTSIVARAEVASQETPAFSLAQAAIVVTASPEFSDEHASLETQPPYEVQAGERVDVRLRASNTGTTAANNVNVALVFPPNVLPVRGATRLNGRPLRERKRDSFSYDVGSIDANETVDVCAQAAVPAPQENGSQLPVAVVLSWDGADGERAERRFERVLTVHAQPAFAGKRSRMQRSGAVELVPGEECEAAVVLFNDGSAAASDVLVRFEADPSIEDVRVFENKSRLPLDACAVTLGTVESGAARKLLVRGRLRSPQAHGSTARIAASVHCRELGEVALGDVAWNVVSHPQFAPHRVTLTLADTRELRPNQIAEVLVALHNDGSDAARDVRLRLYVSPEARIESVEGATRERAVLHFGEMAPGAEAHARIALRLLRGLAKAYPVTIDAVLSAEGTLPVQLEPLKIATAAEPDFQTGSISTAPSDTADAGEAVEYTLYVRNGGDGPARNVQIRTDAVDALVYVPNSTTVNDITLRDTGITSPLFGDRGIVLSDVDPGVDATICWREVVRANVSAGTSVTRTIEIRYDGDRRDEIHSAELHLRSAPAFATSIPGLPFGLDGVAGPSLGRAQSALTEERFVELPPATPVSVVAHAIEMPPAPQAFALDAGDVRMTPGIGTMLAMPPERLQRTLRFLDEARFGGLVSHLFAVRTFLPDVIGTSPAPWLDAQRASLRELLDRLFIKLRLPNYVIAPRDLETKASRETLQTFLRFASSASGAPVTNGTRTVLGSLDGSRLRDTLDDLEAAPLATAMPWVALCACLPNVEPEWANYRDVLSAALDELTEADPNDFADVIQRKPYPVVDAALDVVRARLATV